MAPHEFLLPINLKKSKKIWKFGFFTSGLCLAFKIFFGLFFNFPDLQMSWIFQIIQIWIILKQFCHQIIFAEKFANWISGGRGVRQHCYKKKAATVRQNGRLSALCNFFSFWLIKLWGTTYKISDHAAPTDESS